RFWHVGHFEEAMMDAHAEKALAQLLDLQPLVIRHDRRVFDHHVADDHTLMKHLVVLEIVEERTWNHVAARRHEDGGAGDAQRSLVRPLEEEIDGKRIVADAVLMDAPAKTPGLHHNEDAGGDR